MTSYADMTVSSPARNRLIGALAAIGIGIAAWLALPPEPMRPETSAPAQTVAAPQAIQGQAPASQAVPSQAPASQPPANQPRPSAQAPASPNATSPSATSQAPPPAQAETAAVQPPRFDVVRVGQRGNVVAAGRAEPRAEVTLRTAQGPLGRAQADPRGEWTILPEAPLAPGVHELSLLARNAAGRVMEGPDKVVVVVPEPEAPMAAAPGAGQQPAAAPPTVVLLPENAAPRVLQAARIPGSRLGLDVIDYDERGLMRFQGSAPAGATVRAYVDDRHVGDARANEQGRWLIMPEPGPAPGRHRLRLDQLAESGQVVARIELPFQRDEITPADGRADRIVVQPGNNLWRISRQTYGRGIHYTLIFQANRGQIRDPSLIFPGQVFALPERR